MRYFANTAELQKHPGESGGGEAPASTSPQTDAGKHLEEEISQLMNHLFLRRIHVSLEPTVLQMKKHRCLFVVRLRCLVTVGLVTEQPCDDHPDRCLK